MVLRGHGKALIQVRSLVSAPRYAPVVELVDTPVLETGLMRVQVQVLSGAPKGREMIVCIL